MEEKKTFDEQERWEAFKASRNRCGSCGKKLIWENYEVKGLDGAWVVNADAKGLKPLCFKCAAGDPNTRKIRFLSEE